MWEFLHLRKLDANNQSSYQAIRKSSCEKQYPQVQVLIELYSLYACILLVLMVGNQFLSPEDIDLLLNQVLQNYNCFTVQYSIKVAIISFAELMSSSQQPYITNRLPYLLDTVLCLMEAYIDKNELFQKDAVTDEEKDYHASLSTLLNTITKLN